mmetsp:Transcript_73607/g.130267  ORF Transcript_73607/g.130267 Transcript_73607/m.130267 type:complete len:424 (+) Transcript_73607:75-1346(+)
MTKTCLAILNLVLSSVTLMAVAQEHQWCVGEECEAVPAMVPGDEEAAGLEMLQVHSSKKASSSAKERKKIEKHSAPRESSSIAKLADEKNITSSSTAGAEQQQPLLQPLLQPLCADNPNFKDEGGLACSVWAQGFNCRTDPAQHNYSPAGKAALLQNCCCACNPERCPATTSAAPQLQPLQPLAPPGPQLQPLQPLAPPGPQLQPLAPPGPQLQPLGAAPTTIAASASTTPAGPGWYLSGVDQSCTAGCTAVGLQCFESQQKANNGDVDSSAELKALITQVGGSTNAQFCLDPHGNNPDVPSFGPSYCFHSETTRSLATFDCDQVPVPASENKQRLCYCADTEAPTTTAAPTEAVPPGCSPQAGPMLASMDTDKSGDLSQAECEAYAESNRSPKAEGTQVFTMLDANKDGKVTHAELCAFFGR